VQLHEFLPLLYKISEAISLLDMLLSFSHSAIQNNYVCPEISETMALHNARHPILEQVSSGAIVKNDVFADSTIRMQFVTGPNMSGKTIYLNLIALVIVMAQTGSFVPCDYASIRITDKLLTRIGHDDSRHAQMSSFTQEMRECMFVLNQVTEKSLVIIDELGRGTSTADGMGITVAIVEELLKKTSFVFLATHFVRVCDVFDTNPNCVTLQLKASIVNDNQPITKYEYKVGNGACKMKHYGIHLAQRIGFPDQVIATASEVSDILEKTWDQLQKDNPIYKLMKRDELYVKVEYV
jgi:DNA mismatch repair protein MSH4